MKVYTKTGDQGMTSLIGGTRVAKNSVRLEAYGSVDELNSYIGMIRSLVAGNEIAGELAEIQMRLFDVGGNLATDPHANSRKMPVGVDEEDIEVLEKAIDRMDAEVPPSRFFVLPGGNESVAFCHIARTVCRRTERRILDLSQETAVEAEVIKYINRLSDYLFMLSRKLAHDTGIEELKWIPRQK